MASLPSLPDDVLKLVMQNVPLVDRLSRCALVSRRMHVAAVAATDELHLDFERSAYRHKDSLHGIRPRNAKVAIEWLGQYGQQLTNLEFRSWPYVLRKLPCTELLELQITRGHVQLGPTADGYPGLIQDCTKLTRLKLQCEAINDVHKDGLIDSLSSLVYLQDLTVSEMEDACRGLSVATLPRLQHLTYLKLSCASTDNVMQLSGLTNLHELSLTEVGGSAGAPACVPGAALPASLKKLTLSEWVDAGILSAIPTGLQDLDMACGLEVGCPAGPGSWLSSLGRLQHLTSLFVCPCPCLSDGRIPFALKWPPVGPVYSALTASSSLVRLAIDDAYACPEDIWQFVFPAGCKLPHLTHLGLPESDVHALGSMRFPSWCAADLSRLVSCCPSLCDVRTLPLQPGPHVSELHKLTALTSLIMFHDPAVDTETGNSDHPDSLDGGFEESLRGVAAVTQLRHFELQRVNQAIMYGSLLPLTSLTALTELQINWVPDVNSDGEEIDDGLCMSLSKEQDGAALDVWRQLLDRCTAEPEGQPQPLGDDCEVDFCAEAFAGLQENLSRQQQEREQLAQQEEVVTQPLFGLQELQELQELQAAAQQQLLPFNQH